MKKLFGILLSMLAAQAYAQAPEADLDGNASALQASEMRPGQKSSQVRKQDQAQRQSREKARRERVATR